MGRMGSKVVDGEDTLFFYLHDTKILVTLRDTMSWTTPMKTDSKTIWGRGGYIVLKTGITNYVCFLL